MTRCKDRLLMVPFLSTWPQFVPETWRPTQKASSLTWVAVAVLSIYIGAEKFGVLHVSSTAARRLGSELLANDPEVASGRGFYSYNASYGSGAAIGMSSRRLTTAPSVAADSGHDNTSSLSGAAADAAAGTDAHGPSGSSTGASASGSSASASHGGGHGHKQDALLFLFNTLVLGTMVTHLMSFRIFANLQQTVVLFVIGVIYSAISQKLIPAENMGPFGRSYDMWMGIDPHLILFTLLPALLTGDAMTLDTSVARRVAKQCVYLASIGVIVNAFAAGAFLYWYLPYDWSFLLSLTTGAILCATDPVAVVALLKELGASPTLTVLIEGESLLNDGTAIVMYTISYNMLKGYDYDLADIVMFLVKQAMCAWGLGMLIGGVFLGWIYIAHNKFEHHNSIIQVSLTLCCAYWSFIIAEGVFHISGVLATVAAALVLAHAMWPQVLDKESMHTFWHMLEYLGNTLIFVLAGALTGKVMVTIEWQDYLHLLVIYFFTMAVRALFLWASRPIMKRLSEDGEDVSVAEVLVMTWGGLRGAVGLALAIQVTIDKAGGRITDMDANRVLFFVGGIAALTLVINATTCPRVVNALGVTKLPETKRRLLFMLRRRLLEVCQDDAHPGTVRRALHEMLDELEGQIKLEKQSMMSKSGASCATNATNGRDDKGLLCPDQSQTVEPRVSMTRMVQSTVIGILRPHTPKSSPVDHEVFREELETAKQMFVDIPIDHLAILQTAGIKGDLSAMHQVREVDFLEILKNDNVDHAFLRAINEAFLHIVRSLYWDEMDHGDLEPGSFEADVLLSSVVHAMECAVTGKDLLDWEYVHPCVSSMKSDLDASEIKQPRKNSRRASKDLRASLAGFALSKDKSDNDGDKAPQQKSGVPVAKHISASKVSPGCSATVARWQHNAANSADLEVYQHPLLHRVIESATFNFILMSTIILNSAFIFIEEEVRNDRNDGHVVWLASDIFFNVIFTTECFVKVLHLRHKYFLSSWNLFDFALVASGLAGMVLNLVTADTKAGANTGVLRIARVFRVLRLVRLARLVKFIRLMIDFFTTVDQHSIEIREHMQKINILTVFIRSHVKAQDAVLDYFGTSITSACCVEIAHCILQSQISVFEAIFRSATEERSLSGRLLEEVRQMRQSNMIARELEQFIQGAYSAGIIGASEARSIVHPLHVYKAKAAQTFIRKSVKEGKANQTIELPQNDDYTFACDASLRPDAPAPPAPPTVKTDQHHESIDSSQAASIGPTSSLISSLPSELHSVEPVEQVIPIKISAPPPTQAQPPSHTAVCVMNVDDTGEFTPVMPGSLPT